VDGAVGALGQGLLDGLLGALGAEGNDDDLAAMLLLEPKRLLERVAVGLVHLETDVGFANPALMFADGQGSVASGNLFDANSDFQFSSYPPARVAA
jgi:hypothetical protein